jgi:DNA gyrase subunit A
VQRKNGKGVKTEDDAILNTISTNTIDTLMAFTDKGKMFRLLVDNVPVGTNASKGVRIGTLINMEPGEKVIAITSLHRKTDAEFVLFITKQGLIKKTTIEEYMKVKRSTGIAAIKLKEGDSIANVTFVKDEDVILITKKGMSIHFITKDITPIGRVTAGVKAIKLNEGDEVLGGFPVHKKTDCIATFSEKGLGKKTPITDFTIQGRGGKGVMIYKPSPSTGDLVGAALISDEDSLLLIGKPNSICISATDVPNLGRTSMGNVMIKNSSVLSVIKL